MKTAIIDADHIFFIALTGEKVLDESGEPIKQDGKFVYRQRTFEESCNVADSYITSILDLTQATDYIGFYSGSSTYRKQTYSEYKANRKDLEPLNNLDLMKGYLKDKWNFIWLSYEFVEQGVNNIYETDDYVASFYKQNKETSFIVSPDKDLLALEGNHYNPKRNEWVNNESWVADVNFWKSMIIGDTSDNIKGIPGKGEKYAEKAIVGLDSDFKKIVLEEYVNFFGEYKGIKQFYVNYMSLKIVDSLDVKQFIPIRYEIKR